MSNNPFYKSIKELRNIYEKKEASVSDISNAFIQRIKNLNFHLKDTKFKR